MYLFPYYGVRIVGIIRLVYHGNMHKEQAGDPQPTLPPNSGNTFSKTSAIMGYYMTDS